MVWNEEVTQKPVEEVVMGARAWCTQSNKREDLPLPTDELVKGCKEYDKEYARCFDEWRAGRLQLDHLAKEGIRAAADVQPGSIKNWAKVLPVLPTIVARVFCYFTLCKSGDRCAS